MRWGRIVRGKSIERCSFFCLTPRRKARRENQKTTKGRNIRKLIVFVSEKNRKQIKTNHFDLEFGILWSRFVFVFMHKSFLSGKGLIYEVVKGQIINRKYIL
jgi:hypothetical protein